MGQTPTRSAARAWMPILGAAAAVIVVTAVVAGPALTSPKPPKAPVCHETEPSGCDKDFVSGPTDPCRFIRVTDAEKVIGYPLAIPGRTPTECFNVVDFSPKVDALFYYEFTTGAAAVKGYQHAVAHLRDRVGGVGDVAFWDPAAWTLHVRFGPAYLWVQLSFVPDARAKAVTLARMALGNVATAVANSP